MTASRSRTRWFYWYLGLALSFFAMATSSVEDYDHGAYGVITFLFLWGLLRPAR